MVLVLKVLVDFKMVELVNALRKSADATVAAEAKKLRAKWMDEARQADAEKKRQEAAAAAAAAQSAVEVRQCRPRCVTPSCRLIGVCMGGDRLTGNEESARRRPWEACSSPVCSSPAQHGLRDEFLECCVCPNDCRY